MVETVAQHVQRSALSAIIELFEVDLSIYGGSVYYFTNDVRPVTPSSALQWNGIALQWSAVDLYWGRTYVIYFADKAYQPLPMKSEGWQLTGRGPLPRPTITVSNITGLFSYLNLTYDDLVGVSVRRTRTFAWALDGEPTEDANAIIGQVDHYIVARKVSEDNETCSYELAASVDLEGRNFPSRPMLQNSCLHSYRRWNAAANEFDYNKVTCPYNGTVYRDRFGQSVPAAQDRCAKTLPECLARFGLLVDLGFSGFPGIDRVQT